MIFIYSGNSATGAYAEQCMANARIMLTFINSYDINKPRDISSKGFKIEARLRYMHEIRISKRKKK